MDPYPLPITIRTYSTKEIFIRVRTSVWNDTLNVWEPGPYKDLTGHTFLAQVRNIETDALIATFTVTPGNQADPVDGRGSLFIKMADEITAALTPGMQDLAWDLLVTEGDGDAFPYAAGTVTITKGISHA